MCKKQENTFSNTFGCYVYLLSDGMSVAPFPLTSSFSQPALHISRRGVQIMVANLCCSSKYVWIHSLHMQLKMYHLKVAKSFWKHFFWGQRTIDNKLELFGSGCQTISNVKANCPSNLANQAPDLGLKVWRVVHNVHIGMPNPRLKNWKGYK